MAAPEYVPVKPMDDVRSYESPPRRPDPWRAERPGDLIGGQPHGDRFGHQGPDQGYVLVLARRFIGKLEFEEDEHEEDAVAGCVLVALKRASQFGRAPVIHDLTVAFTVWGFLDESPPGELVTIRRRLFEGAANPHHYLEQRRIVDAVPVSSLRKSPATIAELHKSDWRSLLDVHDVAAPARVGEPARPKPVAPKRPPRQRRRRR